MNRWQGRISTILVAVPFLSLAYGAISWLRYGIDLPFQDDWGDYRRGTAGSFGLENLFRPGGDTLYPVGKFLDAAAQRLLDGHSVAYQFLSMIAVLGLLLLFQWRLLKLVLEDRLSFALAFVLTIFMLQPDTYWGRQNMAYIQALPLIGMLAALDLALRSKSTVLWRMLAAFALSLVAGFSYISGAIAMLATSVVLVIVGSLMERHEGQPIRNIGLALLAGAVISVPAQLWVIIGFHDGQTHRPDAPWTFPYQGDFWLFPLGTVARSLLLPKKFPIVGLIATIAICITMMTMALWFGINLWRRKVRDPRLVRAGIAFITILASVSAYLCIVSAGRAGLRQEDIDASSEVFVSGYRRFYFAWVTLIWPWLAAFALAASISKGTYRNPSHSVRIALPLVLLVCIGGIVAGTFSHAAYYRKLNVARVETQVKCLTEQLRSGVGILCPRLHPGDLASAYVYGSSIGASFTRLFPVPTIRMGERTPEPLFRLSTADSGTWHKENTELEESLIIEIQDVETLRACVHLQVGLAVSTAQPGVARLFFRKSGEMEFGETSSQRMALIGAADIQEVYFHAESIAGFEPTLKLDALPRQQGEHVEEIEVRCILGSRG